MDMHGALLVQRMRRLIRKAARARKRGKDMGVAVDDTEIQDTSPSRLNVRIE
jgi:hypothetical protein